MSLRKLSVLIGMISIALMSGCCCGPYGGGCGGPGGCVTDCNDCEGLNYRGGMPMAYGPLNHLTQMRKSLVCGGGCGEVYYGEWQSTPPDACDPCCDDQFVGGAVPCRPFCWQPGSLFRFFGGFYGQRFCEGCGNSANMCGCGLLDSGCGGSCGNSCGCDSGAGVDSGGCSTCNSENAAIPSTRLAKPIPVDRSARRGWPTDTNSARSSVSSRGFGTRYR